MSPANRLIVATAVIMLIPMLAACQRSAQPAHVYSGSIEAEESRVVSQVGGQVLKILVAEGDVLAPEQVVAEVEATEAQLEARRAEAVVASLQAQLVDLQAGSQEEQVRQVTTQQVPYAQLNPIQAGTASRAIQSLEANIQQAEAARDLANLRVEKSTVKTVPGGTVVSVNVQAGETISPGTGILTLADLSRLWVKVFVPETHLSLLAVGNRVKVVMDAYPDRTFAGEVVWIAARAEFTPQTMQTGEERVDTVFAIKVRLLEGLGELRPGMPVDVCLNGA